MARASGADQLAHLEVRDCAVGESERIGPMSGVGHSAWLERRGARTGVRIHHEPGSSALIEAVTV